MNSLATSQLLEPEAASSASQVAWGLPAAAAATAAAACVLPARFQPLVAVLLLLIAGPAKGPAGPNINTAQLLSAAEAWAAMI